MTLTIIFLCILSGALIVLFTKDLDTESTSIAVFLLVVITGLAMNLGAILSTKFTVKQPKKPIVHIECNGSKCDTTYIYNFK